MLVGESLANEVDHEIVRHELAVLEDRLHAPAELRAVGDRRAQDVARGDVRDVVDRSDALRLRSLP